MLLLQGHFLACYKDAVLFHFCLQYGLPFFIFMIVFIVFIVFSLFLAAFCDCCSVFTSFNDERLLE